MKLKRLLFLLVFVALPSFAYEQQGFSGYQEVWWKLNFLCESQCFVLLWNTSASEFLSVVGSVQGSGVFGYWFLVGQQIYPGEVLQVNWSVTLDKKFSYVNAPNFSQYPSSTQIILVLQGALQANQLSIQQSYMDFGTKIAQDWKDFWTMEPLTPYSINLRYGVKLWASSIVKYGYILFLIIGLLILLFLKWGKERKIKSIFYLWVWLFLFIGIRNLMTYTSITAQWLKEYTFQDGDQKTFAGLGDYLVFTKKIRTTLHLDNNPRDCTIYADVFQDRPFRSHWSFVYLKPCTFVQTPQEAKYLLYYKKPLTGDISNKQILLQFNWSYLLDNK